MANDFLPISYNDMQKRGWDYYDFLYIIGDAYVDHPSFGPSIISRVLENAGYRVAILSQPDYTTCDDLLSFTRPRLGVLISSGNLDSMVNHYTASKKPRSVDNYSEGGRMGKRPDRAVIVYSNLARQAFGDIAVIIGGVEASLRRFAHYDYWQDKVRRSVLMDSKANLLIYGMGENAIVEIADRLNSGTHIKEITDIAGTCYITSDITDIAKGAVFAPSFEEVRDSKKEYATAHKIQYDEQDPIRGRTVIQPHHDRFIVQNKPAMPLSEKQLDKVYSLPYMRTYHPIYKDGVPAINEVKFSITSCRGCYGACNFCALTFHQGRIVTSRSHKSIIAEAQKIAQEDDFKGYIHDVGGPTANFRKSACKKQLMHGACKDKRCLAPTPCPNLEVDHTDYIRLLDKLRQLPGIKKVFVRSGVRFDYAIYDKSDEFLKTLCAHHVSGQLKVAPEHVCDNVLKYMGKPSIKVFDKFKDKFYKINKELGKEQYLVPYLMSSHPGSTLNDAIDLAVYLKKHGLRPEQVQDFYPTPGTTSTCMFYTGLDPYTMKNVYVPKSAHEKAMQRALMQFFITDNYDLVYEALTKCSRRDLIGHGENCLIWPKINKTNKPTNKGGKNKSNGKIKENNRNDDFGRKKGFTKNKGRVKASGRRNEKRGH